MKSHPPSASSPSHRLPSLHPSPPPEISVSPLDFPAAHSMDTAWFAIDQDGYIAACESGEAGAVPDDAPTEYGPLGDLFQQTLRRIMLIQRHDLQTYLQRLQNGLPRPPTPLSESHIEVADYTYGPAIFFLNELWDIQDDLLTQTCFLVPSSHGFAAFYFDFLRSSYDLLHSTGSCQSCFLSQDENLRALLPQGLFLYEHGDRYENWISGLYERLYHPAEPLQIAHFPPAVQKALQKIRFPFSFRETLTFQPIEHLPCRSWQAEYVTSQGLHWPIPDK